MVAVGCILAGEGEGGPTTTVAAELRTTIAPEPIEFTGAILLAEFSLLILLIMLVGTVAAAVTLVAVICGRDEIVAAMATPVRTFCPGTIERAIPVVGPETGTLDTVAVGCTIFAIFTIGVTITNRNHGSNGL
ncbi:hypothetical protein GQX74_012315 [Glossina fuscipes]|nr:hypothetical protein GQX74_012315 [Glossina fuscipes]